MAAYANSLGNGFAYDDEGIVVQNPTVTAGDWRTALRGPWWPQSVAAGGLYRPLTSASFAGEWELFGGAAVGFHAVNVLVHAVVSVLVFALLHALGSTAGALVGGILFAIHPVHTEAVANVVGRAELYAAAFYLAACLLYWRGRFWQGGRRGVRLLGLLVLYLLSLASKEIGVTLPAALLLLELRAASTEASPQRAFATGVRREAATWLLLALGLAAYLGVRLLILGTIASERAPMFELVGPAGRVLTAIALWFQYVRLMLFPLDLVADYDPGVMFPSETLDLNVALGAACIGLLVILAMRAWRQAPLVSVGILFFAVAVLPVANLAFSTGTVLGERTLYLPSVGLALAAAGVADRIPMGRPAMRRALLVSGGVIAVALFVRTVLRNPAWMSTFVVLQTLGEEHPESWRAFRGRAQGLERVGNLPAAAAQWDQAARLAPTNYALLVQAGDFHNRVGDPARAEVYFRRAVAMEPSVANAYQHLAGLLLRTGRGRDAHRVALEGLARAGSDRHLWNLVAESYVAKPDLRASIRAREAALALGPAPAGDWLRMAEVLDALGDSARAERARATAHALPEATSR